jgi:predicted DNA-binding transcriptional regulator AlpA
MTGMSADQYLTTKQVEEITGLTRRSIARRVKAGLLTPHKSFKDTRLNLYRRDQVEALTTITRRRP